MRMQCRVIVLDTTSTRYTFYEQLKIKETRKIGTKGKERGKIVVPLIHRRKEMLHTKQKQAKGMLPPQVKQSN